MKPKFFFAYFTRSVELTSFDFTTLLDPTSFGSSRKKHNSPLSRSLFERHTCPSFVHLNHLSTTCINTIRLRHHLSLVLPISTFWCRRLSPNSTPTHYHSFTPPKHAPIILVTLASWTPFGALLASLFPAALCRFNLSANPRSTLLNTFCILRRTTKNIPCKSKSLNQNHYTWIQSRAGAFLGILYWVAEKHPAWDFVLYLSSWLPIFLIYPIDLNSMTDQQSSSISLISNLHNKQQTQWLKDHQPPPTWAEEPTTQPVFPSLLPVPDLHKSLAACNVG